MSDLLAEKSPMYERGEPNLRNNYASSLIGELDLSVEGLKQDGLKMLYSFIYDHRAHGEIRKPEVLGILENFHKIDSPQSVGESMVLSEGMIPFLLKAGYDPEWAGDLDRAADINNVAGKTGGDFAFRQLEHKLYETIGEDPKKRVVVRVGGDEYVVFKKGNDLKPLPFLHDQPDGPAKFETSIPVLTSPISLDGEGVSKLKQVEVRTLSLKQDASTLTAIKNRLILPTNPALSIPEVFSGASTEVKSLLTTLMYDSLFPEKTVFRAPLYAKESSDQTYPFNMIFSVSGLKEINDKSGSGKAAGNEFIMHVYKKVLEQIEGLDCQIIRTGGTNFQINFRPVTAGNINTALDLFNRITPVFPTTWKIDENQLIDIFYGASSNIGQGGGKVFKLDETPTDLGIGEASVRWARLLDSSGTDQERILASTREYLNDNKRGANRRQYLDRAFQNFLCESQSDRVKLGQVYLDLFGEQHNFGIPVGIIY